MSTQHTISQLHNLKLSGMAHALERQLENPKLQESDFEQRLGMLVDAEQLARDNRRLDRILKSAKLKVNASAEDIDYRAGRGLDKRQISTLLGGDWIDQHQNLIITGPTGAGKTWLACAFANQSARRGIPVLYRRLPRLLEELEIAREDGSLLKARHNLSKHKLLVLDDWGVTPISRRGRQDLLEVIDDRVSTASLAITSQIPVSEWHDYIGEPTIADAILDRIIHSAHRIELKGESMRKLKTKAIAEAT